MVRPLIVLLIASCCLHAAGPHASLPSPSVPDGLGVNIHFTDPKPGEMEMLAAAGFRWVRMDFGWASTERTRGQYDFSAYDRLLAKLDEHHLHAVLILDYGNKLYEPERSVRTAEGRAAFAKWAAAAAVHFKNRGVLWEIWNEPNGGFWSPKANVDEYAALAIETCKAIRAAAPSEAIIGPATSEVDFKFLETCFKAGLLEWWDAVSVHPYRQKGPETAESDYHKLRRLIAGYAPKNRSIPIISGEWGYSSAWQNYDPIEQGLMVARQWLTNLANDIPLSIWYDWHDDGKNPKEAEHHFGTVENDYHAGRDPVYDPKPAYKAAKTLTGVLRGFRFIKPLATDRPEDHALLFGNGQGLCVAVWTESPQEGRLVLPSGSSPDEVIDHLGESKQPLELHNNLVATVLTLAPCYLKFRHDNKFLAEAPRAHPLKINVAPAVGLRLPVRIENPSALSYAGTAILETREGIDPAETKLHINFAKDELEKEFSFTLQSAARGEYVVALKIQSDSGPVARAPLAKFKPVDDDAFRRSKLVVDGDAKVVSEQSLTVSAAPEPFGDEKATVLKLTYRFEDGWKFLRLTPPDKVAAQIEGSPTAFGIWIYGDGNQTGPRLRISDVNQQTWQPSSDPVSWKGWRFVKFSFSEKTAHWGGPNDGAVKLPIHWDSFLVLDSISRHKLEGCVYVAAPVLIY